MPDGVSSTDLRRARVRRRDPLCTAVLPDGSQCKKDTEEAHHWFRREAGDLREREEHMQGVCSSCHADAHRWPGRFPPDLPLNEPFRLDVSGWPRRED